MWVPHDTRDEIVDYVAHWSDRTELPAKRLLAWLELGSSKFHQWRKRYGRVNEHNAIIPRDHWLAAWEKEAILAFHDRFPLDGYRRLTFMLLDGNIVAASAASVYRVLKGAGLLQRWNRTPSRKGQGSSSPSLRITIGMWISPCEHRRAVLLPVLGPRRPQPVDRPREIRESMTERDVETVVQRAKEKHPAAKPRIISDNGPPTTASPRCPIAKDFKEFIRLSGMTHVRTSPYYPQSNGKLERRHKCLKVEWVRPACPADVEEARRRIAEFVEYYNEVRLHSALGYVSPADKLAGLESVIFAERDRKLEAARAVRAAARREVA